MYLKQEVLPTFYEWISSLDKPVPLEEAKKYARYFIVNHIDPVKAGSRGCVYDLFESVVEYAQIKQLLHQNQLDNLAVMHINNLENIANGIVWCVEHDGFDTVKYDPITQWGMDITTGAEHMK